MKITKLKFETDFPIDFFLALNTCPRNKEERYMWAINFAKEWGLEVHSGMTRVAFVFDDFAIKLDINSTTNGCEEEYERFQVAREYEVERILLTIEKWYTSPRGVTFYIQPKCGELVYDYDTDEYTDTFDAVASALERQGYCKRKIKRYINEMPYEIEETEWVGHCVQYYGWKFMHRLMDWMQDYNITDLHGGNIGFVAHNRPVIFDYAGVR